MQVDDNCCVYGELGESFAHVFFGCRMSQCVWDTIYLKMIEIVSRYDGLEFN